jgi:hypothetical protein
MVFVILARRYNMCAGSIEDLVVVGKTLLISVTKPEMCVFALLTMCSNIDPAEINTEDMEEKEVQYAIFAELARLRS